MRRQESQVRASALSEGTVLSGTYKIVGFIGRGGMGEVYEARHARLAGRYAVKVIFRESTGDGRMLERFRRDAEITSSLRHPNIVQVIDFNRTDDGTPYLVMEFLDGLPLSDELRRTGPMPLDRVVNIIEQIAHALSAAHDRGIVHRDLKPDNIYLLKFKDQERQVVKVMDFGVSKMREGHNLTRERMVIGTPGYMAPEQALGRVSEIDAPADQFALASIAYEIIGGRPAFYAENDSATLYQVVNETPVPLWRFTPSVSPELNRVVMKGLEKRPENRYPNVLAFAKALAAVAGGESHRTPRPAPQPSPVAVPGERATTTTESASASAATESLEPGAEFDATVADRPPGKVVTRETGDDREPPSPSLFVEADTVPSGERRTKTEETTVPRIVSASQASRRLRPAAPRKGVVLAGVGGAALVVIGALIASYFGSGRRQVVVDVPVVKPAPLPPPGQGTDRLVKTYLDEADKLLADKQHSGAQSLLALAREHKTSDAALMVRMARMDHAIATALLVQRASNQLVAGDHRLAFEAARQALDHNPENEQALKILLEAKEAETRAAPGEALVLSRSDRRRSFRLTVDSTPPGLVYLDGEPIGRAPIGDRWLRPGDHIVQVRAQGYRTAEQTIKAVAGGYEKLHLVLPAASADEAAAELARKVSSQPPPLAPPPVTDPMPGSKPAVASADPAGRPAGAPSERPAPAGAQAPWARPRRPRPVPVGPGPPTRPGPPRAPSHGPRSG